MEPTQKLRTAGLILMGLGLASMILIPASAFAFMSTGAHNWRVSFGLELFVFLLGAAAFDHRQLARRFLKPAKYVFVLLGAVGTLSSLAPREIDVPFPFTTAFLGAALMAAGVAIHLLTSKIDHATITWKPALPTWSYGIAAVYVVGVIAMMSTWLAR